ncbi:MAG: hypothetical protein ACFE91_02610 [Promethearchaeota archaeon]
MIIGSYYKNNKIKELLNALSPYFLRLNDEFERIETIDDEAENHIIVERFGKYFIFKQFTLIKEITRYYILICTEVPFLNKYEFNTLINLMRDIISHEF